MDNENWKSYILDSLSNYWTKNKNIILKNAISSGSISKMVVIPPKMKFVKLPGWADDIGEEGRIFVPVESIGCGEEPEWERTDWLYAAFWYLAGLAETKHENQNGPIHSYSNKLKNWDPRMWQYPWVNFIGLFLRRVGANGDKNSEEEIFGPIPKCKIILSHDVDAITKTPVIRIKQTIFNVYNIIRILSVFEFEKIESKIKKSLKFLLSNDDYWCFENIQNLEKSIGVRSQFYFFSKNETKNKKLSKYLIDPSYDIRNVKVRNKIKELYEQGWTIGLHPSFDSWNNLELIAAQKEILEENLKISIHYCRQHWLRFGWNQTWKIQEKVGFKNDATLGFNDRIGFRNGAAISFHPWDPQKDMPLKIRATPMVLMDSHLYDYENLTAETRENRIQSICQKVQKVGGEVSVLWHQRVFSNDYSWGSSYQNLLSWININKISGSSD